MRAGRPRGGSRRRCAGSPARTGSRATARRSGLVAKLRPLPPPVLLGSLGRPLVLRLRARLELDLALGSRHPLGELVTALALGVELVAEQDREVRYPEPHQHHYDATERPVGLVIGAEVGDVESE